MSPGSGTHGQGPSFLWANLGFWALTPEQEADGSDLGWSIFKGRTLRSLEMWVPNVGILGEGDQRLGQGWRDYTTSRARVCWLLFFHLPLRWGRQCQGQGFSFPVPQHSTGMSTSTSCAGAGLLGGQVAGVLVCGYEESGHGWVPSWGSPSVSGWRVAVAGLSYGSAFPSCVTVDDRPLDSSQGSESCQPPLSSW